MTLLVTLLTVTVTTTGPAADDVTVALATPLVVVRIKVVGLSAVSVKFAFSEVVANSTAVPFGTAALFCVTVAVIVEMEPVNGAAVDDGEGDARADRRRRPARAARPVAAGAGDGRRSGRRLAFATREKRQ